MEEHELRSNINKAENWKELVCLAKCLGEIPLLW